MVRQTLIKIGIYCVTVGVAVFLCVCFNGCKPKANKHTPRHILTHVEVHNILSDYGLNTQNLIFDDGVFALPDDEWTGGVFGPAWLSFLDTMKARQWIKDKNDCDNFADGCKWFIQNLHNQTATTNCALAFGVVVYQRDYDKQWHKVNVYITNVEGKNEVMFFEPQNGTRYKLSPREAEGIRYAIF